MTSFGTWGMPQMVQKFYSIKDEKYILKAALVSTVFAFIIVFSAYITGSFLHAFFDASIIVNGKPAFDLMVPQLLTQTLPALLMAVYLSGLFCKKITKAGAWSGLISGFATELVLFYSLGPDMAPVAAVAAMFVPFAVIPLVSLFTKQIDKSLIDKAFN
jgi:SSS family solute:Na+ symporter